MFYDAALRLVTYECHSVFSPAPDRGKILLIFYVDDIVITGYNKKGIDELNVFLPQQIHTKDLEMLYFLAIEVA